MKPTQIGLLILKLVVTGALLWYVSSKVDLAPLVTRFESLHPGWGVAGLAILLGSLLLTMVRWHIVSNMVGAGIGYRLAIRLILLGQLFNQVLPSSVGGDGVRAWLLSRKGISIPLALASVVCDRVIGLIMLTIIVTITLPIVLLMGVTAIPTTLPLAIGALTIGGLFLLYRWGSIISDWLLAQSMMRPVGVIVRDLRVVLFSQQSGLQIAMLSVLVQTLIVLALYLFALSLQIELGGVHLLMFPLIILVASIPISFAGWGLRESAMVVGLGFAGIPVSEALALSVTFGLGQLCIGLPGLAIVVLSNPWKSHSVSKICNP
jgi:uncharacterized membrane protein YbhN (UPF0104 family)